jgi:glucose-6-phosphate 1-dehydrogenase
MAENRGGGADLLVIFGITGDLARRMTFRALYRLERRGLLGCPIVGVASDEITAEQLVKHAREAILGPGEKLDDAVFGRLAARMSYVSGDAMDGALYRRLPAEIGGRQRPLYYLEVPRRCSAPSSSTSRRRTSCATAGSPSRSHLATTWTRSARWTPGSTGC